MAVTLLPCDHCDRTFPLDQITVWEVTHTRNGGGINSGNIRITHRYRRCFGCIKRTDPELLRRYKQSDEYYRRRDEAEAERLDEAAAADTERRHLESFVRHLIAEELHTPLPQVRDYEDGIEPPAADAPPPSGTDAILDELEETIDRMVRDRMAAVTREEFELAVEKAVEKRLSLAAARALDMVNASDAGYDITAEPPA